MKEALEPWLKELLEAGTEGKKMTDKQARIVQAAIEVFAEKGYSASSTSEIAQLAGVAEGTIFRHYRTKKDLLLAIATPAMARLLAPFVLREFRGVLDTEFGSFEAFLRAFIANRIEFLERNLRLFKILVQELPFHADLQSQFREAILSQVLKRLDVILNQFKADGRLLDLPNMTIARLCASTVMGYVAMRALNGGQAGGRWDDEAEREATIRFIVRALTP